MGGQGKFTPYLRNPPASKKSDDALIHEQTQSNTHELNMSGPCDSTQSAKGIQHIDTAAQSRKKVRIDPENESPDQEDRSQKATLLNRGITPKGDGKIRNRADLPKLFRTCL